ncbi:MAG: AEC family transporter [Nitrososphaerales archaeon]
MLADIFGTVLLPIVLIVGVGFALGRLTRVDSRPLAVAVFYLFSPCLVFISMAGTQVGADLLGKLALLKALVIVSLIVLAIVVAAALRLSPVLRGAFILAVAFSNSGNFGLSVTEFAFGQAGVTLALICFVVDNLAVNSLGVYFAARGRASVRGALLQVAGNPALYALALGLLVHEMGWQAPLAITRASETLGRAAVPTMQTVLGIQLATLTFTPGHWKTIGWASVLSLVAAPLLAALYVIPLGVTGLARQVGILETAVPTAVSASIVATRYDSEPALVSGTVLVTSLLSLVTVTLVLYWMR